MSTYEMSPFWKTCLWFHAAKPGQPRAGLVGVKRALGVGKDKGTRECRQSGTHQHQKPFVLTLCSLKFGLVQVYQDKTPKAQY